MKRAAVASTLLAFGVAAFTSFANAQQFSARFSGFEEVGGLGAGQTGAIYSPNAKATLSVNLDKRADVITYKLTYSGLVSPVSQSHIHFGKRHVGGGIMVFLCSNLGNGPAGTPACPANGGTVTGTLTPAQVVGPTAQNITPGNFDGVVAALVSNTAYGNIHTTQFPAGEIRGQLTRNDNDDDDEQ